LQVKKIKITNSNISEHSK